VNLLKTTARPANPIAASRRFRGRDRRRADERTRIVTSISTSMIEELRLGTRGSQLALWQANTVAARIAESGGPPCRIVVIKTSGDRLQDAPLSEVGGKRLFVKEIEDALLRNEIDIAVHSSKDMPAVLPDGLAIAGVLPREDPLDAVVLPVSPVDHQPSTIPSALSPQPSAMTIDDLVARLGQSPSIGTGSVRRTAQLTRIFPGARFTPIRGNLDTRLRKLDGSATGPSDQASVDALVLASAGLRRLGFASRISVALPVAVCVPAPGQGIVAIEIRDGDDEVRRAVRRITDAAAEDALEAERAVVAALAGGCQTPVGALAAIVEREGIDLTAVVVALDGSRAVRANARGPRSDARGIGARVGAQLLADGADAILSEARHTQGAVEGIQP
jgi:hydroxymethylbilane synthase